MFRSITSSCAAIFIAAFLVMSAPMTASAASGNNLSAQKFVTEVGATNLLEIKLGKLALQKSHNHVVRVFAHWMIFDHSKVQRLLKGMAKSQGLSVPSQVPASVNEHYTKMAKLSGEAFDKAYANFNVKGHEQAVALLKKEKASDNNAKLSQFAASGLPIIEGHLMMAEHMQAAVENNS